ncbi:MAG: hypothetical protein IJ551_09900 [Prevotella sp.]|nr:hypothetical protein [Prevotella sp.]
MAKKFWEREGFDIALFAAVFSGVYNVYYDSCDYGREYDAMVIRGDQLLQDSEAKPLLTMFANYRMDIVTSDREAAALAVTYGIFERRYKA